MDVYSPIVVFFNETENGSTWPCFLIDKPTMNGNDKYFSAVFTQGM